MKTLRTDNSQYSKLPVIAILANPQPENSVDIDLFKNQEVQQ